MLNIKRVKIIIQLRLGLFLLLGPLATALLASNVECTQVSQFGECSMIMKWDKCASFGVIKKGKLTPSKHINFYLVLIL